MRLLLWAGTAALLATGAVRGAGADEQHGEIVQPAEADREQLMKHALEMRWLAERGGDRPYGIVLVRNGRLIDEGASVVLTQARSEPLRPGRGNQGCWPPPRH